MQGVRGPSATRPQSDLSEAGCPSGTTTGHPLLPHNCALVPPELADRRQGPGPRRHVWGGSIEPLPLGRAVGTGTQADSHFRDNRHPPGHEGKGPCHTPEWPSPALAQRATAAHLVIAISISIFSVGYSSQAARPTAQGDRWRRGPDDPGLAGSARPDKAGRPGKRGPQRLDRGWQEVGRALTNVLRVERSNHQQEGPCLPVESGDGEVEAGTWKQGGLAQPRHQQSRGGQVGTQAATAPS